MELLQKQYALVSASRDIVLDFLETQVGEDQFTPVPEFDNKSVNSLLVHVADCYFHWLSYYAMHEPVQELNERNFKSITRLRELYKRVDQTVSKFLEHFGDKMDKKIEGVHASCGRLRATPVEVMTHVFTHEFHHKGQIMSICRLLGHIPPDTDISNFFEPVRVR